MGSGRSAARSSKRRRLRVIGVSGALLALGLGTPATSAAPKGPPNPITYYSVTVLQPNTRPFWIAPGPDGNMWFTDTDADRIGRITMDGHITMFKVQKGARPYTIVAGPDGKMWFTEWRDNKLGVMDTHGRYLHAYPVAATDLSPYGIAVSPDGYVWFTAYNFESEDAVNKVGRMSTDGNVVETYTLETPCACEPLGIAAGPDGNMWVTEELGSFEGFNYGAVDKVSPDGKSVTRYKMPDVQSLPAWIAAGPDGRLWFSQFNAEYHQFGRITTHGDITNFHINADNAKTAGVTTGPDGKIWFTEPDANDIWSMRPNGSLVDNFPLGAHAVPAGIAIGPDGNLWFAVAESGEIGRLHVARPRTHYILDIASGFVPMVRTAKLGHTVQWVLEAPGEHGVRDATGLDLFASGLQHPVSFMKYVFTAAGTYPYRDRGSKHGGAIVVPMRTSAKGPVNSPITLRWATKAPAAGDVFDVQIRRPGSRTWDDVRVGVTGLDGTFTPHQVGTYAFRARLRDSATGRHSGWSPGHRVLIFR